MGDIVNLNKFRKRSARNRAGKQAEINRVRFGRTKAECSRDEHDADRAIEKLDQHRIVPEDSL